MRAPGDRAQWREMARLRALQYAMAERETQKLSLEVNRVEQRCSSARSHLASTAGAWRSAVERPHLDMMIVAAWAGSVCDSRDDLDAKERGLEKAVLARTQAEDIWRLALLRKDMTQDLCRDAERAADRAAQERATLEAGERHAARRSRA